MMGRVDSWTALEAVDLRNPADIRELPDVSRRGWYFPYVLAVANDHRLGRTEGGAVVWIEILPYYWDAKWEE